ncbi:MAG: alpha/beta hydrolase [Vicinamibacterales bacterium]
MQPHGSQPVMQQGEPLGSAPVLLMIHGRGAGPKNILDLVPRLARPGFTCLAPAAAGNTWYPYSFMAETAKNQPGLDSALDTLRRIVDDAIARGVPAERIVILGFSQGACLTSEFAARHARRYGGIIAFTGGLIGPPGTTWDYPGAFDGTPIFLGCSDVDHHVPKTRVDETEEVFTRMGAAVDKRIYPGMEHIVNDDEIAAAQKILEEVAR